MSEETPAPRGEGEDFDPFEYVRKSDEIMGIEEEETEDVIIVYGEDEEDDREAEEPEETPTRPKEKELQAEEDRPVPSGPVAREEETKPKVAPEPQKATETTKPSATTPKEPQAVTVRVPQYWIQAGAFKSRDRLDQARLELSEQGLGSRITTKVVNDSTFYRLRVGPFEKKAEAEKFLDWMRDFDGFSGSYISLVYAKRTVMR